MVDILVEQALELVILWTQIAGRVAAKAQAAGVEPGHTFFWEEAMHAGFSVLKNSPD